MELLDNHGTIIDPKRRDFIKFSSLLVAGGITSSLEAATKKIDIEKLFTIKKKSKKLHLYSLNFRKTIDITYYENGKYIKDALQEIDKLMADRRTNEIAKIDTNLIDTLYELQTQANSSKPITIISGYRALETNNALRKTTKGVSSTSYHTKGKAVDITIENFAISDLNAIAKKIHDGGLGYYPKSHFVHLDTGPKRNW